MMIKQNRALGFLFIFVLVVVGLLLVRSGQLGEDLKGGADSAAPKTSFEQSRQDAMGDPVQVTTEAVKDTEGDVSHFSELAQMLASCFQLKTTSAAGAQGSLEELLRFLQVDWGALVLKDRWMSWHFNSSEGVEHRLRLEVSEDADGVMGRDLQLFAVDKMGEPIRLDMPGIETHNPSDNVVSGIIKGMDVFYKEKATLGLFANGARIEIVEKNGSLADFILKSGVLGFECQSLKDPHTSCRCQN